MLLLHARAEKQLMIDKIKSIILSTSNIANFGEISSLKYQLLNNLITSTIDPIRIYD
jgi:hypothetical protein